MDNVLEVDWSLYLVTDPGLTKERSLIHIVEHAIKGGVGVVQYRDKKCSTGMMVKMAKALSEICRRLGACFLVNDRVDVALAVDADGVHVGQDDMPVGLARELLGKDRLIGVTVHNAEEVERAEKEGADYLSFAPVYATFTKPDHQTPLGPQGVKRLSLNAHIPAVAIGGINHSNAEEVVRSGARGVCVVSAILTADDPLRAARNLYDLVQAAKG